MDLSIIIVNWNVKDLLRKCLKSIYRQAGNIIFEVVVIDNNSGDESARMVTEEFPGVILKAEKSNLGFARANNQGMRLARGRYFLLLNPDTEIADDCLEKMVEAMDRHKNWAAVGCKIVNPDGTTQPSVRNFPALTDQVLILLKLHHFPIFKERLDHYLARDFDYEQEKKVEQVMGAFLLVRRETLESVGWLDEGYYLWFEEVDLCKRIADAGLDVYYTPRAKIIHHGGASFKQLDWRKQIIWNHSLQRYFWKHKAKSHFFVIWMLQPPSIFLAWATQTVFRIKKILASKIGANKRCL